MFVLLSLAVVLKKSTLLSGNHKHAFPTCTDTHFPENIAPEDAAPAPDSEAVNSKDS